VIGAPVITSPATLVPKVTRGVTPIAVQFEATGLGPITWSVTGTLPPGMTFHPDGRYTGTPTPTVGADYPLTIVATNAGGSTSLSIVQKIVGPIDGDILLTGNRIAGIATETPDEVTAPVALTGVTAGDVIVGIDRRAVNGLLYAVAVTASTQFALYVVHPTTAAAYRVGGVVGPFLPAGERVGFDWDPVNDRFRVVTAVGQNFRLDPNSGALANTDGVLPFGSVVEDVGYTGNESNLSQTTAYLVDAGKLVYSPNLIGGSLTTVATIAPAVNEVRGLDVAPGIRSTLGSGTPVEAGEALAVVKLATGGGWRFARVDLVTAQITKSTALPATIDEVTGFAVQRPELRQIYSLFNDGKNILRSRLGTFPALSTQSSLTSIPAGETIESMAFNPREGQLMALGIGNADTATLYRIDPRSAAVTVLGTLGGIQLVDGAGAAVPLTSQRGHCGMAFEGATNVIRVVCDNGLHFRITTAGATIDGDVVAAGVNPDGPLSGGATGLRALSFTEATGTAAAPMTAFGLSAVSQSLHRLSPDNTGTVGAGVRLKKAGVDFDFTALHGFTLEHPTTVATAGGPVTAGTAIAFDAKGGNAEVIRIDLVTGDVTAVETYDAFPSKHPSLARGVR